VNKYKSGLMIWTSGEVIISAQLQPFTAHFQVHTGGIHIFQDQAYLLDLQHNLQNIFSYARNITELMQDIHDADGSHRRAFRVRTATHA